MATNGKVLGQAAPAATTETPLYTVPGSLWATGSSIVVCNRGATDALFRISVSVGGGATANTDYINYDVPLPATDTYKITPGLTLTATDVVRVYASTANVTFQLFGTETDIA